MAQTRVLAGLTTNSATLLRIAGFFQVISQSQDLDRVVSEHQKYTSPKTTPLAADTASCPTDLRNTGNCERVTPHPIPGDTINLSVQHSIAQFNFSAQKDFGSLTPVVAENQVLHQQSTILYKSRTLQLLSWEKRPIHRKTHSA